MPSHSRIQYSVRPDLFHASEKAKFFSLVSRAPPNILPAGSAPTFENEPQWDETLTRITSGNPTGMDRYYNRLGPRFHLQTSTLDPWAVIDRVSNSSIGYPANNASPFSSINPTN